MKKTEALQEKLTELKKKIGLLIDEFNLENGDSEICIDLVYHYAVYGVEKRCIGRDLNLSIKIQ